MKILLARMLAVTLLFSSVGLCKADAVFLSETFEDGKLDDRSTISSVGTFSDAPAIKSLTEFGSTKAFGFGRSTCGSSCFDRYQTSFLITFKTATFITGISFKEMELYDNWGSSGSIWIDGVNLPSGVFGRTPVNDHQADTTYRERVYPIEQEVTTIELRVVDITNRSEIFIDDLVLSSNVAPLVFSVGGMVSGLDGSGLVLQNNLADDLPIDDNGEFSFVSPLNDGCDYMITVLTQPSEPTQNCSVSDGSGTLNGADVTNVSVMCAVKPDDMFTDGFEG